ncbi:uncharacterized protein BDR25DRAFT_301851 [Lindgomyces ingoldianus]|uniref:Uncharacterized protein n=1 Tax=Lindgomyces ingoldianus TaxID=673940 RepID=A0ACB6R336_9PLEO|nr:uncharacterized protein BDR25DRAFT_301851 [Lindgomyces ingoldianus]KAF2473688.1 hypothetical protein BDR25DRAFT_301851 [Lindgomyces ingoldianus]
MHSLSLSYPSALALARKDREIVTPNSGFVKQLELWGELGCSLIDAEGKEKGRFAAWKKVREDVMRGGEEERNRARVRAMASMAARFGARRLKSEEEREESGL